ncbi:thioredoxin family protein [Chitinophaga sp. Cy-1792]|uniref:DUF1223 domain-containing protein n=1 Tax=Chitinophaga sp. Cy-1792 TaxID=2608339 RepID=UPI001420AAA4|nr:DUF1223 domain-containing protein [Chitinophaga sp. Cy-1792]NIG54447.1 DUF1223 domain-containing protein [Chitinophaga sp. Cy-1792]
MKKLIVPTLSIAMICLSTLIGACNSLYGNNNASVISNSDSTKGFAVVELFTSEGCSSCPPADALLEKLEAQSNGKPLYLLAFHVDYWDHQGWRDSFSQHEFSLRQEEYAGWLNLNGVYTPQVVINGSSQFVGSDAAAITYAINQALTTPAAASLTLKATSGHQQVNVSWDSPAPQKNTRLLLALVQKNAQSMVRAGENAGRKLSHVQIVKDLTTVNMKDTSATLPLPAGFDQQNWELIGLLQNTRNGHVIAASKVNIQ